jgi:hypothetical protein
MFWNFNHRQLNYANSICIVIAWSLHLVVMKSINEMFVTYNGNEAS